IGFCDNFLSNGQSAVWSKEGGLVDSLDNENEGLLLYDTELEKTEIWQPKIEVGQLKELAAIFQIYQNARQDLKRKKVYQWIDDYPNIRTIERDLQRGTLYVLKNANDIVGAISINEDQPLAYQLINWQFDASKVLVIHRLAVEPKYQGKGYAQALMDFAENFSLKNDYTSIRLDTYSQNDRAIQFYEKRGYLTRGNVNFSGRTAPFYCMEKDVRLLPKK
ncbi:MAG: GNAT family N-acetyltransferase, partial [Bacteroidota bacterium]